MTPSPKQLGPDRPRAHARATVTALLAASAISCGAADPEPDVAASAAIDAALSTCPARAPRLDAPAAGAGAGSDQTRVFVEAVVIAVPDEAQSPISLAHGAHAGYELLASPHILAVDGREATISLVAVAAAGDAADPHSVDDPEGSLDPRLVALTVLPRVDGMNVSLALDIEMAVGGAASRDRHRTRTTVSVRDEQLVVLGGLGGPAGARKVIALVRPYVVRDDADLRRIFECKKQHRARAARSG